jgi:hypothetical protein
MMGGSGGAGAAPGQHPPSKPEEEKPKEAPPKN